MRVRTEAKRQAILAAAGMLFLRDGYAAASMVRIAAAVGGSKTTLYGYFPSKEAVFSAFVAASGEHIFLPLERLDLHGLDLSSALTRLAATYLRLLLSPQAIAIHRVVIAEVGRFPELGRIFFESGRGQTSELVARHLNRLAELHSTAALDSADAVLRFRALCEAGLYERRLWGVEADVSAHEIDGAAARAVSWFLHGYD